MKIPITVVCVAGICALTTACSPSSQPVPISTVSSTSSAPATAPAPPPSPTPGMAGTPTAPKAPGAPGADGSTGNGLSPQYCAQNEDPGCPVGTYVGPGAIANPNGDGSYVPCEGTICTNPNHGAGPDPTGTDDPNDAGGDIPEPGQDMEAP